MPARPVKTLLFQGQIGRGSVIFIAARCAALHLAGDERHFLVLSAPVLTQSGLNVQYYYLLYSSTGANRLSVIA